MASINSTRSTSDAGTIASFAKNAEVRTKNLNAIRVVTQGVLENGRVVSNYGDFVKTFNRLCEQTNQVQESLNHGYRLNSTLLQTHKTLRKELNSLAENVLEAALKTGVIQRKQGETVEQVRGSILPSFGKLAVGAAVIGGGIYAHQNGHLNDIVPTVVSTNAENIWNATKGFAASIPVPEFVSTNSQAAWGFVSGTAQAGYEKVCVTPANIETTCKPFADETGGEIPGPVQDCTDKIIEDPIDNCKAAYTTARNFVAEKAQAGYEKVCVTPATIETTCKPFADEQGGEIPGPVQDCTDTVVAPAFDNCENAYTTVTSNLPSVEDIKGLFTVQTLQNITWTQWGVGGTAVVGLGLAIKYRKEICRGACSVASAVAAPFKALFAGSKAAEKVTV